MEVVIPDNMDMFLFKKDLAIIFGGKMSMKDIIMDELFKHEITNNLYINNNGNWLELE